MASGTILRTSGGVYDVELEGGTVTEAVLRGRLKLEQRTGDRVVVGDAVSVARQADGAWTIEEVAPRRSELARQAPGGRGRRAKVMVANMDRLVVVFAAAEPEPNARLLDRFLVLAEANDIAATIVLNKADLADDVTLSSFLAPYRAAGYATLCTSVPAARGVADLRHLLCAARSVIAGPSGAGKSSLLNVVQPGLGLRIGAVSSSVHKGQHTTVSAQLIPLACGGYVADTPGLRELGLWDVNPDQLDRCFPEFQPFLDNCRFGGSCTHTHEPDCAVQAAVAAGTVAAARWHSYVDLRAETSASATHGG